MTNRSGRDERGQRRPPDRAQLATTLEREALNDADRVLTAWLWGRANCKWDAGAFRWGDGRNRPMAASYVAGKLGWGLTKAKAALQRAQDRGDLVVVDRVRSGNGRANVYRLGGDLLAACTGTLEPQVAAATAGDRPQVATATPAPVAGVASATADRGRTKQGPIDSSGAESTYRISTGMDSRQSKSSGQGKAAKGKGNGNDASSTADIEGLRGALAAAVDAGHLSPADLGQLKQRIERGEMTAGDVRCVIVDAERVGTHGKDGRSRGQARPHPRTQRRRGSPARA